MRRRDDIRQAWLSITSDSNTEDVEELWDKYLDALIKMLENKQHQLPIGNHADILQLHQNIMKCVESYPVTHSAPTLKNSTTRLSKGWTTRLPNFENYSKKVKPPVLVSRNLLRVPSKLSAVRAPPQGQHADLPVMLKLSQQGILRWRPRPVRDPHGPPPMDSTINFPPLASNPPPPAQAQAQTQPSVTIPGAPPTGGNHTRPTQAPALPGRGGNQRQGRGGGRDGGRGGGHGGGRRNRRRNRRDGRGNSAVARMTSYSHDRCSFLEAFWNSSNDSTSHDSIDDSETSMEGEGSLVDSPSAKQQLRNKLTEGAGREGLYSGWESRWQHNQIEDKVDIDEVTYTSSRKRATAQANLEATPAKRCKRQSGQ